MAGELTLTEMQAQLKSLITARNSGVLIVRHGDTQTTFQTLAAMNQTITTLRREIAAASGEEAPSRVNYVRQSEKGY